MVTTVGPLSSVNERLVALEIVRQVLLLRFSLRVRKLMINAINDTEVPVARLIRDALRTDAGLRDPAQVRQLDGLIVQLNAMRRPAWDAGRLAVQKELVGLAESEPEDQRDLFAFLLPGINLVLPSVLGLGATILASPFHGRTLREWFDDAATDDAKRIRQAIYLGAGAGDSPAAIARRVVGSAKNNGVDGVTQTSRNHVDTIIRSGTVHFSASSRDWFYKANAETRYVVIPAPPELKVRPGRALVRPVGSPKDPATDEAERQVKQALDAADKAVGGPGQGGSKVFTLEQFVAILDSRTTKLCRGLDGHRYRLGVGPIPPLHMNCRSTRVLVLPQSIGGPIFDPGRYGQWVRSQPEAVQVMLMGSTKDNKMRDEDLADAAFKDYGARPMTLKQIRDEARRIMEFY